VTVCHLSPDPGRNGAQVGGRLERQTFTTSRLAEFTSVDALITSTGHHPEEWSLLILKELTDNGIDNAEAIGVAPKIEITVSGDGITITDNGGGIAPDVVERILDYAVRTSSTEAYASPTRGQQGNALQTVLAIPFALHGKRGETIIETGGVKHTIIFEIDPVRRTPAILPVREPGLVKIGTRITVKWPVSACSDLKEAQAAFLQMAVGYAALNPHLSIRLNWYGNDIIDIEAPEPAWAKWRPNDPTSAHWYDAARFDRLIANMVAHDQDHGYARTVREFIAEFRGMKGTALQKRVLDLAGASRMPLATLFKGGKQHRLRMILQEMTRPVTPIDLGIIGREHLQRTCIERGADPDSFDYRKIAGTTGGLPWVVETAFAHCPDANDMQLITGCNWSPGITNQFETEAVFGEQRLHDETSPVIVAIHLTCPVLEFTDRGKSYLGPLPAEIDMAVDDAIIKVSKAWAKQRKAEERDRAARARRLDQLARRRAVSVKDAAYTVMEQAYLAARGPMEDAPANARQVMYQARPLIQEQTGKQLDDAYFTQTLLPDYMTEHDLHGVWNVVFDDRGHFLEPHTDREIGIGTLAVREYLDDCNKPNINDIGLRDPHVATFGPSGCFGALLYIEKEGFMPLFQHARLAERFDIAILSSKGMPSTSTRRLVEMTCSEHRIPLLVLHDFDKAGMSIAALFSRDNRRYQYERPFDVIDIGLRLADARQERLLRSAEGAFDKGDDDKRRDNLRLNGAIEDEVEFLLSQRVELNALPSDRFIRFVERKLVAHGIGKVMPGKATLQNTYRAFVRGEQAKTVLQMALAKAKKGSAISAPADLADQVARYLKKHPHLRWDEAVAEIAGTKPGHT
jgi:DNA topoisomerase VI subunit B